MKLSLIATALAALASSVAVSAQKGEHGPIDTSRGPKLFEPPRARRGGYTYADEFGVKINAKMDSQGMSFSGELDATADTKMIVKDLDGGKMQIDLTLESVKGGIESFLMTVHCDSDDRAHSDPDCASVFDVVGSEEIIVMTKEGDIISVTTPDGETLEMEPLEAEAPPEQVVMQQETLASKFRANQFAASHHFDKSQQLLKLIPDHAVRPGDSWIDDVPMDGFGTFKGDSRLVGYTQYEGVDCAIFEFEGTLHLEIEQLAQILGVDDVSMLPSKMADAQIYNQIIWDYTDDISRWTEINITTSFDMPNPMNPQDPTPVHVPFDVSLSLNTDIIGRPDHEAEPTMGVAYKSYESEQSGEFESSSENSGKKKSGGGFKVFFFIILVAGVVGGGYVFYKKQREGQEVFVRPSYEFSPVGADNGLL